MIEPIIRDAGCELMRRFGTITAWDEKLGRKDDVESEADRASEQCIVRGLKKAFPGDAVLTEEHPDVKPGKNGRIWIIDSLDGSRNFVLGIPIFGISIALVENDEVVFGMIFLPAFDELYWAERGKGAYRGDQRLAVSGEDDIARAMISVAVVYRQEFDRTLVARVDRRLRTKGVWDINLGNLVIPICYVAAGRYAAVMNVGAEVWDFAAGVLLIEEAGGVVTDLHGKPWSWLARPQDIVAANSTVHRKILTDILGKR